MRPVLSQGKVLLTLLSATILFYLPILAKPDNLLERGNDLQEFFWPIFYFVKNQIVEHQTFPLWNNLFLSGTPLLPDPQSPLFYLPNILFLILPMDTGFITSFMLHSFLGGVGAYLTTRKGFGLSQGASTVAALLYIVFPRTAGFLEAGHFGLVASSAWLPYLVFAGVKLTKAAHFGWSVLLAISLAGLFFTHPTTFIAAAASASVTLFVAGIYLLLKRRSLKTLLFLGIGILTAFGLIAVALLPQLEWLPQTTRFTLLEDRDVYPKWGSKIEFIRAIYPHILGNRQFINSLDTEKWLALGIFVSLLAFIGFIKLGHKLKLLLIVPVSGIVLVALNNASPLYSLLLSSDWYVLARVSTRIWFIIPLVASFLAGFGFEVLRRKRLHRAALILAILATAELLVLSWLRVQKPLPPQKAHAPAALYEFLKNDSKQFRVFCVNRCLSQRDVAKYNIETIEGYSTLTQANYFNHFIQLSQVYWDRYTLALPPFEIYNFRQIQPYSPEIADYNVKYVISPHPLKDKNLSLKKEIEGYLVYENAVVKSRAYFANGKEAPITYYSPNYIKINTSAQKENEVIVSEVYSPGWTANLNGKKEAEIIQTPNKLRRVKLAKDTEFIEMRYNPRSYLLGKLITTSTLFLLLGSLFCFLRLRQTSQSAGK